MTKTLQQKKFETFLGSLPEKPVDFSRDQMISLIKNTQELHQEDIIYNLKVLQDFFPIKEMIKEKSISTVEEYVGKVAKSSCQGIFDETRDFLSVDIKRIDHYINDKFKSVDSQIFKLRAQNEAIQELRVDVDQLKTIIATKVDQLDFKILEDQLQNDTPTLVSFERLRSQVQRKAEWDDLNDLNQDVIAHKLKFQNLYEIIDEVNLKFKNYQQKTNTEFQKIQQTNIQQQEQIQQIQKELQISTETSLETFKKEQDQLSELRFQVNFLTQNAASKQDFEKYDIKMKDYARKAQFQKLKDDLIPQLKEVQILVEEFKKDNKVMLECVKNFDISLCEKVNLPRIFKLEQQIVNEYFSRKEWEDVQKEILSQENNRLQQMNKLFSSLQQFRKEIQNDIQKMVSDITQSKLQNYDNVAKSFNKFLNNDNLQDILDNKVDMEIIKKIQDQKADRVDFKGNEKKIDSLNKRLKNVSILLTELAKSVIPHQASSNFNAPENINYKVTKQDFISKQALILQNFILQKPLLNEENFQQKSKRKCNEYDSIFYSNQSESPKQQIPVELYHFEKAGLKRNFASKTNVNSKKSSILNREVLKQKNLMHKQDEFDQRINENSNFALEAKFSVPKTSYGSQRAQSQLENYKIIQRENENFDYSSIVKNIKKQISNQSSIQLLKNQPGKISNKFTRLSQGNISIPSDQNNIDKIVLQFQSKTLKRQQSPPKLSSYNNEDEFEEQNQTYLKNANIISASTFIQ